MIYCKNTNIGHREVLFNIEELRLKTGRLVSLIGPNGTGKTTFFETLLGEIPILGGEINIDNKKVNNLKSKDRVELFSHVGSKFSGVEHLSVYELIGLGRAPFTNFLNRLGKSDHEIVQQIIKQLNIEKLANKNTTEISDGERQIAMLGKALAQKSKIIILDEPTAFLDYRNKQKIMRILSELAAEQNLLILISNHDIDLALKFSDEVIAIDPKQKSLLTFAQPFDKKEIVEQIFEFVE